MKLNRFMFGILACLLLATSSWAQGTTGSIEGTVTDQSGAAIAGVDVKAKNTATGTEYTTAADATGFVAMFEKKVFVAIALHFRIVGN